MNVELFATGPFMENFSPIYQYKWMFLSKTVWVKAPTKVYPAISGEMETFLLKRVENL